MFKNKCTTFILITTAANVRVGLMKNAANVGEVK